MSEMIQATLEAERLELLDLSLRNPLLNYKTLRARGIDIVDEDPAQLYDVLVERTRAMTFSEAPEESEVGTGPDPKRHTDSKIQTTHPADELEKRLRNTQYSARTFVEEQGVNVLFLALGTLVWYEDDNSQLVRRAPLLLIPVELHREEVRAPFKLTYSGDDIVENLPLMAKLQDFGINLPALDEEDLFPGYFDGIEQAVAHLPRWQVERDAAHIGLFSYSTFLMYNDLDNTNWPEEYRPSEHPIISSLLGANGFSEPDSSYSDATHIDDEVDPAQSFHILDADSSQFLALLDTIDGRNLVISGPPGCGKSQTITNIIAEALGRGRTVLFVAEKLAALEVVKRRLDGVGLGVACLELHSHKANKKAVLDALRQTMKLGEPKHVHNRLDTDQLRRYRDQLNAYAEAVNTPILQSGITPYTAYGALARIKQRLRGVETPKVAAGNLHNWNREQAEDAFNVLDELSLILRRIGVPREHPYWGSQLDALPPSGQREVRDACQAAIDAATRLKQRAGDLAESLGVQPPDSVQAIRQLIAMVQRILAAPTLAGLAVEDSRWLTESDDVLEALQAWQQVQTAHRQYDDVLIPEAWEQDVLSIRQAYVAYGPKWWRVFSGAFRRARNELRGLCQTELPDGVAAQTDLVEAILVVRRITPTLHESEPLLAALCGERWDGLDTEEWDALAEGAAWLGELHQDIHDGILPSEAAHFLAAEPDGAAARAAIDELDEMLADYPKVLATVVATLQMNEQTPVGKAQADDTIPFAAQESHLIVWRDNIERLPEWVRFNQYRATLMQLRLAAVATIATDWPLAKDHLVDLVRRHHLESLLHFAQQSRPILAEFNREIQERRLETFRELDKRQLEINRVEIAEQHWQRIPQGNGGGQLGILQREFHKKRRHMPIRKLIGKAGHAIQTLKPVFMMSPMSIAMYLPPAALQFDLVVFDEASQVRPVEALGAIARGRQTIVVGDEKQLPPTSFFRKISDNDDDDAEDESMADLESILGVFLAKGAPERMLRWHYRSQHESLIAVSNREFYGDRLVVFPSPDKDRHNKGIRLHHHPETVYQRGRSSRNPMEAQIVAAAVMRHAREHPHTTLGVAAFSTSQMTAIQDALELLRRHNPVHERFFHEDAAEPFFIKNLENVQGDERDVIFISVGYGRDAQGRVSMNFGPLNKSGGERRLNVLITRARQRCEVFSNIKAEDLDLSRTQSRGVAALKQYLHYAETGQFSAVDTGVGEPDSPFEVDVADALRRHGYQVHHQVGTVGFYIDLGIVDPAAPGRYLLGIECDGATYHSARAARDRDRLRQSVLERLGWRIHRIWSTDWFQSPRRELRRALDAIEDAKQAAGRTEQTAKPQFEKVSVESVATKSQPILRAERREEPSVTRSTPYTPASVKIRLGHLPLHELPPQRLAGYVEKIVAHESPVHEDVVVRRITKAANVGRAGKRIQSAIFAGISLALAQQGIKRDTSSFLWTVSNNPIAPRDRSDLDHQERKWEFIADAEIAAAIHHSVEASLGMHQDEIPSNAGALLGYSRITRDPASRIEQLVALMVEFELLVAQRDMVLLGPYAGDYGIFRPQ